MLLNYPIRRIALKKEEFISNAYMEDAPIPPYIVVEADKNTRVELGDKFSEGDLLNNHPISIPSRVFKIEEKGQKKWIFLEVYGKFKVKTSPIDDPTKYIEKIKKLFPKKLFLIAVDISPFVDISYRIAEKYQKQIKDFLELLKSANIKLSILGDKRLKDIYGKYNLTITKYYPYKFYESENKDEGYMKIYEFLESFNLILYDKPLTDTFLSIIFPELKMGKNLRVKKGTLLEEILKEYIDINPEELKTYEISPNSFYDIKELDPKNTIILNQKGIYITLNKKGEGKIEYSCIQCRNCNTYCPKSLYPGFYRIKGKIIGNIEDCIYCGICNVVCPSRLDNVNLIKGLQKKYAKTNV